MKNKKILIIPVVIIFLLLVILYLSLNKNNAITSTLNSGNTWKTTQLNFSKLRNEITLNDISKVYLDNNYKTNNELLKKSQDFLKKLNLNNNSKITNVVDWWITLEYLNSVSKGFKDYTRNFQLELNISDNITKKPISSWVVYVNWVKLWEFKDWVFKQNFAWFTWIEVFNITIRSWDYWDWFLVLNSINSSWELLVWNILLKKSEQREIDLSKDENITFNNFSLELKKCSLADNSWNCFNKTAKLKANYISSYEANNNLLTLNMNALDSQNNSVYLKSWWMAFLEFITDSWEILQLKNWETFKLTYKITQNDIDNMWELSQNNWYWYYDKNAWIWLKSNAKWTIDTTNKTITFIADKLY